MSHNDQVWTTDADSEQDNFMTKGETGAMETTAASMSAAGFFVFTLVATLMSCYILYHVVGTCRQFKDLSLKVCHRQAS